MKIACKRIFFACWLFLLFIQTAAAQLKCKVEFYSTEQGLSHQAVTAMLKDSEGFMWFGSWDGINRFDGHSFVSYKSSPGDRSQLGNDRIDYIVEDQAGHLWIQAYDRRIYRFDKKTEQFLPLSSVMVPRGKKKIAFNTILTARNGLVWLQSVNDGLYSVSQTNFSAANILHYEKSAQPDYRLPSNTIRFFYEDRESRIWIGTPDGLGCLVRSASGVYQTSRFIPKEIASGIQLTAYEEDAGRLYFSTADGRLISFDKDKHSFSVQRLATASINALCRSKKAPLIYATTATGELITLNLRDHTISKSQYQSRESLFSLYEDHAGVLWIEPETLGVIRFNPSTEAFRVFSQKVEDPGYTIGNRFKVFEDSRGIVWVNMKGGGFGYYDSATATMAFHLDVPGIPGYRLPRVVFGMSYDSSGVLWLRIYGRELIKIVFQRDDFKQHRLIDNESLLADNEIRGILFDSKQRLWLGSKSGKLYVRQGEKWLSGVLINEPSKGIGPVYSITEDSKGNLWFATKRNGLFKAIPIDKEKTRYKLSNYLAAENDPYSNPRNQVYAVLEDLAGRVWIGTFDRGLLLAVEDGDSTKFVHSGDAFKNYPKEGFQKIRHLALDSAGNIWIATTDGLLLLDANSKSPVYRYKFYSKIPGDKKSLGNNDVQFIHRDAKNRMWLATSGGGFSQAIGSNALDSLQFRNYTTRDGLPNDYTLSCGEDRQGYLWIATENGLSRFDPDTHSFRNYDSYDGLPRLGFSEASVCRQWTNGELIFGTTDGYLSFDPAHMTSRPIHANIAFTNLQINNEDVRPGANESMGAAINYVSGLKLKHDQNIVSIDYAILDQRGGSRQYVAYRLLGFDSVWHDDRQAGRVTYTNLQPGHYVFQVKSFSTDLYSNRPFRQLSITVLPPPWKTWWAYLIYIVVIAVVLYFIRRYAVAMIRLRNKVAIEQKLAALKLNFFTNVSHELRTPLTLIVNPLEQLSKQEKLSARAVQYLDVARKNAERMVRFVNQLLDLRKVQSEKATLRVSRVDVVNFVKKIADHFTEAARTRRVKLEVVSEADDLMAWFDAEKIDVVVFNLLGNAIKFTPEGKTIQVRIQAVSAEQFSIAVHDQGPGVPKEKLEDIFELFNEGEQHSTRGLKGTGIGLALSREFVNLHQGNISAANNEDGGLTVTILMKLGSGHYGGGNVSFVDQPKGSPVFEKRIEQQLLRPTYNQSGGDPQAPLLLLVEDNDELRAFIAGQLSEFYRVEVAKNGEEGLKMAVSLLPDLIVSDIMMPGMDGIQMLDQVKNNEATSHIPVVLLSAKYSIESQIEGLKYGADYYITKPFNNEFLIASIDNLLLQRKKLFEVLVEKKKTVQLSPAPMIITSRDEVFLKEVIQAVETSMAETDFNIESLAGTMAMNANTFYKKFKSLTGLTPVEFVRDMRLQRARQYLDSGENNVSEVAYLVGFSSPKYFSTCFREKYHMSPSEYLNSRKVGTS